MTEPNEADLEGQSWGTEDRDERRRRRLSQIAAELQTLNARWDRIQATWAQRQVDAQPRDSAQPRKSRSA